MSSTATSSEEGGGGIAAFGVRQRVFVNLLFVICALVGIQALGDSVVDVYPDISFDQGSITVVWPGASPEEIETAVTMKIEEEILDVPGILRVVSHSERDRALIDVKFREDLGQAAFESAFQELRARVDRVDDLPGDAERPVVTKISTAELFPTFHVAVAGKTDTPLPVLREVTQALRDRLRVLDGVRKVSDIAIPEREWLVQVDRERMEANGLDLLSVTGRLSALHRNLPAGTLERTRDELAVGATGEFTTLEGVLDAVVGFRSRASPIRLREIATIERTLEELAGKNRINGLPCVNLTIAKESDADALELKTRLEAAITSFNAEPDLPEAVGAQISFDTTDILESRLSVLVENLAFGVLLVFLALWALIGARNSFLAIIGIPFSFLLAYAGLAQIGVSINAITLFSLMLVSGMVVDDAIVVLENVYRKLEEGLELTAAIIAGTREVFWPVVTSSLTTMAAFLPMLLMSGVVGEFMSIIPKTVIFVLVASLIECLIILPAHYLHFGSRKAGKPNRLQRGIESSMSWLERVYIRRLGGVILHPWRVVAAVIVLAVGAVGLSSRLPVELFPSDLQAFYCNVWFSPESGLDATGEGMKVVEEALAEFRPDRIETFTTSIGSVFTPDSQILVKPSVAQLFCFIPTGGGREVDPTQIILAVRKRLAALEGPAGEHRIERIEVDAFNDGPPVGKPVAIRIAGPDYAVGQAIAHRITAWLEQRPGLLSINDNFEEGPRELRLLPRQRALEEAGVTFREVSNLVFAANEGLEIGDVLEDGADETATLRVRLQDADRSQPSDLMLLRIASPHGGERAVSELVRPTVVRGASSLYHYDGQRVVLVTADVDSAITDSKTVNEELIARFSGLSEEFPGYTLTFGGEFEETTKSFDSLGDAAGIAIVLIFTILAAQFRSYRLPLVIMAIVPFSFVGVVLGLWLLGFPFTVMAFIAIVGLSGVVVNDSLVLLDFIRRSHQRHGNRRRAIEEACRTRLRPVLLTTVTTVFGLLPMALGLTGYSKVWSPFAATITFGLLLAMGLTLVLVPAAYVLIAPNPRPPEGPVEAGPA